MMPTKYFKKDIHTGLPLRVYNANYIITEIINDRVMFQATSDGYVHSVCIDHLLKRLNQDSNWKVRSNSIINDNYEIF